MVVLDREVVLLLFSYH